MNLKGFKKVEEDDQKAVLKNQHGHSITIAKKALSKQHLEGLNKLPLHSAGGGQVKHYAEGSDDGSSDQQDQSTKAPVNIFVGSGQQPQEFQPGQNYKNAPLPGQTFSPQTQNQAPARQMAQNNNQDNAPAPDVTTTDDDATNQAMASGENASAPGNVTGGVTGDQNDPSAQNQSAVAAPSWGPPLASAQNPVTAEHQRLNQQADLWHQDLANGHVSPETYQSLFAKKDTLGKIGTIFGLILGGIGSGMTHQPNAALQMMNQELDRDLEAQKQSKGNAQNFLRIQQQGTMNDATIHRYAVENNLTDAQAAQIKAQTIEIQARNRMMGAAAHSLGLQIDQMPEGPGKQTANMASQNIQQAVGAEINNKNKEAAQKEYNAKASMMTPVNKNRTLAGANASPEDIEASFKARNDALMQMGMAMKDQSYINQAKFEEDHHITGYAQRANRAVSSSDRTALEQLNNLDQSYQDAHDYIKKTGFMGSRSLRYVPGVPYAEGEGLEGRIETEIGQLSGQNRYTQGLKALHQKRMPDLVGTHFTNDDSNKINELQTEVRERRASILGSYGIGQQTAPKVKPSDQAVLEQWLKENPDPSPRRDRVKRILGQP